LHRFGVDPDYERWRALLLGEAIPDGVTGRAAAALRRQIALRQADRSPVKQLPEYEGRQFVVTRRNTPALFGAALLDSIPDTVLRDVAREQQRKGGAVSGRVAPVPGGVVGRFGWRGQTSALRDFVRGACANELGLEIRGQRQAADPLDPAYRPDGHDLSFEQCEQLVSFVKSLPPPGRNIPASEILLVDNGEHTFERIGCADCHRAKLGEVDGLYSDLLLHDMGSQLIDPLPAQPDILPPGTVLSTGYYSSVVLTQFTTVTAGIRQEWRTPPLWGVADSAPYLHDGRAETLEEAILAHGGEAESSAHSYRSLSVDERTAVLAFLKSLSSVAEDGKKAR
jgi:CxxC motif-containing protein (DUF1111 family)